MRTKHEEDVEAFLKEAEEADPDKYADVCEKYPVQDAGRQRSVRQREITVGHLGLSPARLSYQNSLKYNAESVYQEGDE